MRSQRTNIKIGLINFPGAQRSALLGLIDMFETATKLGQSICTVSFEPRIIELNGEPAIKLPKPGTLKAIICPPRLQHEEPQLLSFELDWLNAHHKAGCLTCSACAGAFVLASAGILNARPATTHWQLKETFQVRFPDVLLETDKLLIDDGDIITAGGVMAWVDLGLRLIERFQSPALMLAVARQFLVEPGRREQRFYSSFLPRLSHGDSGILKVQHWLQRSYRDQQTIKGLAEIATMSQRTFLRRFLKMTGFTPISYLQALRVEKARDMLELSTNSFSQIAIQVGYQDAAAFRRVFFRIVGLGPREYRRRFGIVDLTKP